MRSCERARPNQLWQTDLFTFVLKRHQVIEDLEDEVARLRSQLQLARMKTKSPDLWEGRFKAQPLLDEMAIAACMAYVDLNPIRAGIADAPETSDFTSVQARIEDRQSAAEVSTADAQDVRTEQGERAGWLSPIALEPPRTTVRKKPTPRRASNQGCLPMSLDAYLKLVNWTGRQIRQDKRGRIPEECAPILERLNCGAETWLDFVENFLKRFRTVAGQPVARQSFRSILKFRRQAPLST